MTTSLSSSFVEDDEGRVHREDGGRDMMGEMIEVWLLLLLLGGDVFRDSLAGRRPMKEGRDSFGDGMVDGGLLLLWCVI